MVDVRQRAKEFLDKVPPNTDVTSNGATAALFTTLTGWSHEKLQTTWAAEDIPKAARRKKAEEEKKPVSYAGLATTTTCNEFVGQMSGFIPLPFNCGRFDIEKELKRLGLGDAWIPANSGKKPGVGDVFKPKRFHLGVSRDFEGDMWNTTESGQGGPGSDYKTGKDIIRRKRQPWDPNSLEGWVDIELLVKLATKAPKWMIGWWKFEVGTTKAFVYIPERGAPRQFTTAPPNFKQPPASDGKAGEITHDADTQGATIAWPDNVTDKLRHLPGVDYMLGDRGGQQIQAFKQK